MDAATTSFRTMPEALSIGSLASYDGWPLRTFRWEPTGGIRGTILFQTGRGDFFEKYLNAISRWGRSGWRVEGFDWRGSGGSGRLTRNSAIGHIDDFEHYLGDLATYRSGMEDRPGPLMMIGHSMGGNILLRHLAEGAATPDGLILSAPMLGLNSGFLARSVATRIVNAACRLGLTEKGAWRERDDAAYGSQRQKRLTHDRVLYDDELWWKKNHPELHTGAPSWGWLASAYRSIEALEKDGAVEAVATPTLVLAAARDALIPLQSIEGIVRRMPNVHLIVSPEGAHELLRETDTVSAPLFAAIDRFLESLTG